METILSAVKTWTKGKIKESTADWNENDSSKSSYVKNRTHWEEKKLIYLVPEMTVTISEDGGYETLSESCPILTAGQAYTVVLNGVTYECIARQYDSGGLIGNGTIYGDGDAGNSEPFSCDSYDDGTIYLNAAIAGNYTISISTIEAITHKLDKKYLDLPTNLATTDDVESAKQEALDVANTAAANAATAQTTADSKMNTTNPIGTGSFSMNRLGGSDVGKDSSTFGTQLIANTDSLMVNGRYNIAESNYMLQETTKTSNGNKSNAFGYKIESFEIDDSKGTFICINKSTMKTYATAELNALYFNDSFAGSNVTLPQRVYKPIEKTYNGLDTFGLESYTIKYIEYTIVQNDYTHAHIVGNGSSDTARSNAHTLDWEGNAWYSGDVYVGSTSGTNRDEGSKKLATVEEVQELASQISSQSYVAQTEAPEDKNLLWLDLDDESDDEGLADAIQAAVADVKNVAIPVPKVAEVGQTVVVKEVDGNGKPVAWEAVNLPSGDSIPEKVEFTLIGEGTLVPTETVTAIDTGVTWADVKDFDWFEIGIESNAGITGQKYWFYNRDYIPEAWRRFFLCGDRLGRSRFKKVANGVYEWFCGWGAVNSSGVSSATHDYANDFPVLNGPSAYLIRFNWVDTDKFYIYPSVAIPENGTHKYKIMGIKFK